jgi:hypothetical protein
MPQVWLTYEELGELLQCESSEVRQAVIEHEWARRRSGDGLTLRALPHQVWHGHERRGTRLERQNHRSVVLRATGPPPSLATSCSPRKLRWRRWNAKRLPQLIGKFIEPNCPTRGLPAGNEPRPSNDGVDDGMTSDHPISHPAGAGRRDRQQQHRLQPCPTSPSTPPKCRLI